MLLAFCHLTSMADEKPTLLVLEDVEGYYWGFYLNEQPTLIFGDKLSIKWKHDGWQEYAYETMISDFRQITYRSETQSNIVNIQTGQQTLKVEYGSLIFSFSGVNNHVAIYSISGMLIFDRKIPESGEYYFPLSELSKGIYIVKINNRTQKITIK